MAKKEPKSKKKDVPIYVIAGEEESLLNLECEKLLNQLLGPQERMTGLYNAEAAALSASELLDELRTLPFLTERRVVLVKGADKFVSANRQLLENYFDNPCPTGVLVLTVTNWDARTRLAKKLSAVGKLIALTQPSSRQLPDRLVRYAADAHGKNLNPQAAELLVELAGDEQARLYSEVDKLAVFADSEKAITVQHVESLIGHNRLFNAFAVIDAVISGDTAKAVERLRNMFTGDRTAQFSVVGAFAFHFRRMFGAKVLLKKGMDTGEIANRLRIWGDRNSYFARLREVTLEQIGSALQKLAAIDYAIKTGRAKAEIAIEQFVYALAGGCDGS